VILESSEGLFKAEDPHQSRIGLALVAGLPALARDVGHFTVTHGGALGAPATESGDGEGLEATH
jgi:hypothetical protein